MVFFVGICPINTQQLVKNTEHKFPELKVKSSNSLLKVQLLIVFIVDYSVDYFLD